MSAEKIRTMLTTAAAVILGLAVVLENQTIATVLLLAFVLAAMILYYKNIRRLKPLAVPRQQEKVVKIIMAVLAIFVVCIIVFAVMLKKDKLEATDPLGRWFMTVIFACIILVIGLVAGKLPYKAPMGLRLPWANTDSDAWYVAHNLLKDFSVPMGILCFAGLFTYPRVEGWLLMTFFAWLLVPSMVSHTYILRKWKGKI